MWDVRTVFAQHLRAIRHARGLSQEQLAERAGLAASSVAAYEQGSKFPMAEAINALGRALDIGPGQDPFDFASMLLGRASSAGAEHPSGEQGEAPPSPIKVRALADLLWLLQAQPDSTVKVALAVVRTLVAELAPDKPDDADREGK